MTWTTSTTLIGAGLKAGTMAQRAGRLSGGLSAEREVGWREEQVAEELTGRRPPGASKPCRFQVCH